jgi:hypothetical protein
VRPRVQDIARGSRRRLRSLRSGTND